MYVVHTPYIHTYTHTYIIHIRSYFLRPDLPADKMNPLAALRTYLWHKAKQAAGLAIARSTACDRIQRSEVYAWNSWLPWYIL